MGTALILAGCGRDPGPKGDAGPQGPAGPQACKAWPALKGNRVPKGRRDRRVRLAQRAIPDRLALPSGRFRPTARSVAMQVKTWCRCSVHLAVHPMAPSAAAVWPLVFVSKS